MIDKLAYFITKLFNAVLDNYLLVLFYLLVFSLLYKYLIIRFNGKKFFKIKSVLISGIIMILISLSFIFLVDRWLSHQPF